MNSRDVGEYFGLTTNQKNILDAEMSSRGTSLNNIAATLCFEGIGDIRLLSDAVHSVIRSDPSLRTRIASVNGGIMQYHAPYDSPDIPVYDFSMSDRDGYMRWADEQSGEPFFGYDRPLYRFAVCKMSERLLYLFVCTHHMISDGWTQMSLCNRISRVYLDLLGGKEAQPETVYDYADYAEDEKKYLSSAAYTRDAAFWKTVFDRYPEAAVVKRVRGAVHSNTVRRASFRLSDTLGNSVYSYCQSRGVSPFTVFYAALAAVLRRSGCPDSICVGVPVFNRRTEAFRKTTGMFVSTVPFVCDVSDIQGLDGFCGSINETWMDTMRHQRYPFADIAAAAGSSEPLFGVMLSYQETRLIDSTDEPARVTGIWHCSGAQREQLCIHVTDMDGTHGYEVRYDYLSQVLTEKDISALHTHICRILQSAIADPSKRISSIPIADSAECDRVIGEYNKTDVRFPSLTPYGMILRATRGKENRAAVIYRGKRTTYAQLLKTGNGISAQFDSGTGTAAILLPRGPELLASVCAAMQAGCPFCIINPSYPENRIFSILGISEAKYLISSKAAAEPYENGKIKFIDAYSVPEGQGKTVKPVPGQTAYTVFTSGSTGVPKGVCIGWESLCNLAWSMESVYGNCAVLSLCNQSFDAFILESAAAMMCGRTVVVADDAEAENPAAIAALITEYGANFIAATPSRMSALMNNRAFREASARLETVICGGEALTSDLLCTLKKYTHAAVYNQYGPSEATVAVSMARVDTSDRITAGRPMSNCRIYVLDEEKNPMPENVPGEIYIGGVCVGKGYINNPRQTAEKFMPSPFIFGETVYRTGDVGMYDEEGRVVILGRRDGQLKIRGLRIETGEITACISSYEGVSAAAARAVEKNGQVIIVGYYAADREIPEMELLAYTAKYLPKYMIPAGIVRVDGIPLTPNGKINEKALPDLPDTAGNTAPANGRQAVITGIFRKVLGNDTIGTSGNYFLYGGNSLNAMETVGLIEETFGVRMPVSALYACRTAEGVDRYLCTSPSAVKTARRAESAESDCQVSPTQQSIYIAASADTTGRSYMMPCAFVLGEEPDAGVFEEAFRGLIGDDPVFRTSFEPGEGGLCARVHGSAEFSLPVFGEDRKEEAYAYILAPFDLSSAPLIRAALCRSDDGKPMLLVNVHHIICDGLSVPVLVKRLDGFIRGHGPEAHRCYRDSFFPVSDDVKQVQLGYWKKTLDGVPAFADIPTDRTRPAVFDGEGADITVRLGKDVSDAADRLAARFGVTPYVLFAGAVGILRSRLSGDESVVIGTPVSGRIMPGTAETVGPLMRTVPLRMEVKGNLADYFGSVRMSSAEMIDNSDCGIGEIAAALGLPHVSDRNPLYQMMFQMRPVDVNGFVIGGRRAEYLPIHTGRAKLDINCECERTDEGYSLYIEYASALYDRATVEFRAGYIGDIIRAADASPDGTDVRDIPLPPYFPEAAGGDVEVTGIHRRIENVCAEDPGRTAVIWHGSRITFADLMRRADGIAALIAAKGVKKGDFIGICSKRTPDLIAALTAVLKLGCAYVPFLDTYPAGRISYMMETAGVKTVITDSETYGSAAAALGKEAVTAIPGSCGDTEIISADVCASDPMYVLFTSGSTGQPKGVKISVGAIENLLCEEKRLMKGLHGPVLCTSNYTFDIFITESLLALSQGMCVVLADDEEACLPWKLAKLITDNGAEIAQFTPSRLRMCLRNGAFEKAAEMLKYTITAGENVPPSLVSDYAGITSSKLVNMYGPTESAVYVTAGELIPGQPVTIGHALRNCRLYVLDENRKPVIPGRRGELYIGGMCLSDGYISRPDLTEKAFYDDPFVPGEKMYRSGDIVRLRTDGSLECFGRIDGQIKINGIRVELGEINEALLASGASGAASCVKKNPDGSSAIGAVITPEDADPGKIKEALGEKLPPYMIPSLILPVASIPVNPSGKADMPLIRELLSGARAESPGRKAPGKSVPDGGYAELLESIWAEALGHTGIDPDLSFFGQGGSSLTALNVIGEYYNRGIVMTLQQFYGSPTLRGQLELIAWNEKHAEPRDSATNPEEISGDIRIGRKEESGDILLTGATGFLGIHLLRELLREESGRIICLTRDGSRERLDRLIGYYFGGALPGSDRIEVVKGDVLYNRFGMSGNDYYALLDRVSAVVHAAADVRHYSSDSLISKTNVEGTRHTAGFALEAGAEFAHISTASISGTFVESNPDGYYVFTENDTDIGQDRDNEYIKAKFTAEKIVGKFRQHGLRARIFRVGRLIGRSDDGTFQINPGKNAFRRIAEGFGTVGAYPETLSDSRIELLPVDVCAAAIVRLLHAEAEVFHIVNPSPVKLRDVFRLLPFVVRPCSDEEFSRLLGESLEKDPGRVASLVDYMNTVSSAPQRIALSCEKTVLILRDKGFEIPGDIGRALSKFSLTPEV